MPSSFIFRTNQGKLQYSNTYYLLGTPPPVTINSVVASASPYTYPVTAADVSGTSITNGINYKVLSFASVSTTTTYTVNYTCASATTIYVLAVGGGGSGGYGGAGGGGGGGVVMNPISIPSGSGTINISVGAGGSGITTATKLPGITGNTTTVTFSSNTSANIVAYGGGGGGQDANIGTTNGGSSGGNGASVTAGTITSVSPITNNYNYGNYGGGASSTYGAGGGGAGTNGISATSAAGGIGGSGIQCFLPGINNFSPSGTSYLTYYWSGGGGGAGDTVVGGNGGIGGGGGGGRGSGTITSVGGTGGINSGGVGNATNGGNGGANTGSGGGGLWNGGTISGAGGSGIVIIAFPSATAVSSNQAAVLPASIFSSGLYSATLNNATLTSLAYNSIKGAYACRLLNYNYFGPIMTLRCSTDICGNYTQNFYSDICGNMGTGYLGTGQSVSAWLSANSANTTYAFVTKWYNQGMDVSFNCATQYTTTLQPVYDVSNGLLNFGYTTAGTWVTAPQTGCYFNLPNASFPIGDASLTFVTKVYNSTGYGTLYNQGPATANKNTVAFVTGGNYIVSHMGNDFSTSSSFTANNVVSYTYAGNNGIQKWYKNGTNAASYTAPAAYDISSSYSYIANSPNSGTGAIQMYYLNVFSSVLNDNDRQIMEATPYSYSVLPSITGLATSSTTTTFVLSWTTVANAKSHVLWINGSAFQTYGEVTTTGTITPGVSGAWNINLYAYSATNVLLATGYSIAQIPASVSNNGFPVTYFPFWSNTTNYATNANDGSTFGTACVYTSATGYKAGVGSLSQPTVTGGFLTNPITYTSGAAISFGGWFNMTSSGIFCYISMNGGSNRYFLNNSTGINLGWNGVGVGGAQGASSSAFTSYTNGTWIHIIVVIPSSGNTVAYVNGSLVATPLTSTTISPGATFTNVNTVLFGYNGPTAVVTGNINNFYIFNRTLSATEVTALYNQ